MNLAELLRDRNIRSALIVDDACDAVPKAGDIGPSHEAWPTFSDDLTPEQRERIIAAYPRSKTLRIDELVADHGHVAAVWELRGELGESAALLFATYEGDQAADHR